MAKRKRRNSKKRRNTKRFRKGSRSITSVRMGKALFPNEVFVRLKYADTFNVQSAVASLSHHAIRGNGMFDPDQSLGGHQPRGYDQYAAIYNNYMVYASKVSYVIANSDSTTAKGIVLHQTSQAPATVAFPYHNTELPYHMGPKHLLGPTNEGYHDVKLKGYMTTKRIYGDKDLEEDEFGAPISTVPIKQWYHVLSWSNYEVVFPASYNLEISLKVTYFAKFFDRKQVVAS